MNQESIRALQLAAQSFAAGRLEDAESTCRLLLEEHPLAVDVLHLLALVRRKAGDPGEGETLLRNCLSLDPRRAEIHANLGNLLAAAGRIDEAMHAYRDAITHDPGFRPARLGLARLLNRIGACDAARQQMQALIEVHPAGAEAWVVLATALRGLGRPEQAASALRRAVQLDPSNGPAHHSLAALIGEAGGSEQALSELELAAAAGVKGPAIDFTRASTLMSLYRFDDAERLLADSVAAAPQEVATQRLLARLRFMRGAEEFAAGFASAVQRYPGDVALRLGYAQALRGAGRLDDAHAALQDGLRRDWKDPRLYAELAALRQETGDFEEALQYARSALSLRPEDFAFQEVLIDALLSLGRADEAMPVIESLRRRSPLNQWYIAMEATAARLLGDPRYAAYYDYDRLVQSFELSPPPGWASIEAFHAELVPVLLERHQFHAEPLDQSLRSGTQTPRSLLGDPDPLIRALLQALTGPVDAYRKAIGFTPRHPFTARNRGGVTFKGCWSVLLKRGGYHVNHVHTEGWISSAYYVEVPPEVADETAQRGWLKFGEPRFPVPGALPGKLVQPRAGRLVLFPSYLWHGTTPTVSDARRLTVAFDVVPRDPG